MRLKTGQNILPPLPEKKKFSRTLVTILCVNAREKEEEEELQLRLEIYLFNVGFYDSSVFFEDGHVFEFIFFCVFKDRVVLLEKTVLQFFKVGANNYILEVAHCFIEVNRLFVARICHR